MARSDLEQKFPDRCDNWHAMAKEKAEWMSLVDDYVSFACESI